MPKTQPNILLVGTGLKSAQTWEEIRLEFKAKDGNDLFSGLPNSIAS